MVTEKEIIDDLFILSGKLSYLMKIRESNSKYWEEIRDEVNSIIKRITLDKQVYGW